MHSNAAIKRLYDSKQDTRHNRNRNSKSNNTPDRLWELFQSKNDKVKTLEKDRHNQGEIFSDSEISQDSVQSTLHYSSNRLCAQPKNNLLSREILPMDDSTQNT